MIEVSGLSKAFGPLVVLDEVSFHCPSGCVTGFLGPNGAGKSTTLRLAVGLSFADTGSVVFGQRQYSVAARDVGVVLGPSALPTRMSAIDAVLRRARFVGVAGSRAEGLLEWVGLKSQRKKRVAQLSLGQKQRLGIAMALLTDPEFLVMDEPFNGLDPEGVIWLRELLMMHADGGGTAWVSSHLISELQEIVGHVVILKDGRVVMEGDPRDYDDKESTVVLFEDPEQAVRVLESAGLQWQVEGRFFIVGASAVIVGRLAAANRLVVLEQRPAVGRGLERLYLDRVGETRL